MMMGPTMGQDKSTMTVIGELVHTFWLPVEKPHLTSKYEVQHIPLRDGGTRKMQLEVVTESTVPKTTNVKVTLIDGAMGEMLSGDLYYEIAPGHKKMISEDVWYHKEVQSGQSMLWNLKKHDLLNKEITLDIQVMSPDSLKINPEEMQKKNAFALAEDCATLRKSGLMSDVTIVCEGERFPAHKLILSARSKVFAAMFSQNDTVEERQQEVHVKALDKHTMERFLTFLYDAALPEDIPFEGYVKLLKAANEYQVPSLIEVCNAMMVKTINMDNAVKAAIFGTTNRIPELKNAAIRAIAYSGATLSSIEGYEELRGYPDLLIEIVDYRQGQ